VIRLNSGLAAIYILRRLGESVPASPPRMISARRGWIDRGPRTSAYCVQFDGHFAARL